MNQNLELLKIRLLQLNEITTEDAMFRRINGLDWNGYTMIGLRRLDNLEYCINKVIEDKITGAIVEAGVWRGGAMIFAAGVLKEMGQDSRKVYVCDIFDGTFPESGHTMDKWAHEHDFSALSVSRDEVAGNFMKFGFNPGSNIKFLKGWFSETLSTITEQIAILRIDGDTYQSTMDTLVLEPQIPSGGFIIMDDWAIESSQKAFLDYFGGRVTEKDVVRVDSMSVYWRKP